MSIPTDHTQIESNQTKISLFSFPLQYMPIAMTRLPWQSMHLGYLYLSIFWIQILDSQYVLHQILGHWDFHFSGLISAKAAWRKKQPWREAKKPTLMYSTRYWNIKAVLVLTLIWHWSCAFDVCSLDISSSSSPWTCTKEKVLIKTSA